MTSPGVVTSTDFALPRRQVNLVMTGVFAGVLLSALDQAVVATALPRIVSDIGGLNELPWVVTAYLLTSMAATPIWGKLSDTYGRRVTFQAAIGFFLIGSLLCGISQNIVELIVFRAVQGVGAGGLFVLALGVVGDVVPPAERGRYQGYFGAVFGVASMAGPVVGGFFAEGPGWRWVFFLNVPIGLVSLAVVTALLRLPVTRRGHVVDYPGAILIVSAVSALLLALNWSGTAYGWGSTVTIALLVGAAVLVVAAGFVERRAAEPIVPMALFRQRVVTVGSLFSFLVGAVMLAPVVFLPVFLQAAQGLSPTKAGLGVIPLMLGITLGVIGSGRLVSKTGRYKIYAVVGAGLLVLVSLALTQLRADTPYWQIGIVTLVLGIGLGMTSTPVLTAVQNGVDMQHMGAAISTVNFFQRLGGAVGVAVFGAVFAVQLAGELAARHVPPGIDASKVQVVNELPEPTRGVVVGAFASAVDDMFLAAVPFVALAFVVGLFLTEVRVARSVPAAESRQDKAKAE